MDIIDMTAVSLREVINMHFQIPTRIYTTSVFLGKLLGMTPNIIYETDTATLYIRNTL